MQSIRNKQLKKKAFPAGKQGSHQGHEEHEESHIFSLAAG